MGVLITEITFKNILFLLLGSIISYNSPEYVNKIIRLKERKKDTEYKIYNEDSTFQRVLIIFLVSLIFFAQSMMISRFDLAVTMFLSLVAIIAMQVDRKIRIIPNELVLIILFGSIARQIVQEGITGVVTGIMAMLIVGLIFFMAANISKAYYGHAGVGAGDIKLTMAMAAYFGTTHVFVFMLCIALVLLLYILYGFLFKKYTMMTTFPMGLQITYGFLFALFVIQVI